MANLSLNVDHSHASPQLGIHFSDFVFIAEGMFMVFGNALVMSTVILHKQLRTKGTLPLAGLAAADFIYGIGVLSTGVRRVYLIHTMQNHVLYTAWQCMLTFPSGFYLVGYQLSVVAMIAMAVDRYISTKYPIYYFNLTTRYSYKILTGLGLYGLLCAVIAYLSFYFGTSREPVFSILCDGAWAVPPWYSMSVLFMAILGGFVNVFIYAMIVIAYKRYVNNNVATQHQSNMYGIQLKRQRKLTLTFGIVTAFTFCCHTAPYVTMLVLGVFGVDRKLTALLNPYVAMLVFFNSIVNAFIYTIRHRYIRGPILGMLRCKKYVGNATSTGRAAHT